MNENAAPSLILTCPRKETEGRVFPVRPSVFFPWVLRVDISLGSAFPKAVSPRKLSHPWEYKERQGTRVVLHFISNSCWIMKVSDGFLSFFLPLDYFLWHDASFTSLARGWACVHRKCPRVGSKRLWQRWQILLYQYKELSHRVTVSSTN